MQACPFMRTLTHVRSCQGKAPKPNLVIFIQPVHLRCLKKNKTRILLYTDLHGIQVLMLIHRNFNWDTVMLIHPHITCGYFILPYHRDHNLKAVLSGLVHENPLDPERSSGKYNILSLALCSIPSVIRNLLKSEMKLPLSELFGLVK